MHIRVPNGFASTQFILLGVYHPGSQALSTIFFNNLSAVFDQCPDIDCDDFNIHVDVHALRLTQLMQCGGFIQQVAQPTHKDGHS